MANIVEKVWQTKSGYKACCLFVNDSHRCGYVGLPQEHSLYGKNYRWHLDKDLFDDLIKRKESFKGSPIDVLIASGDKQENNGPQISYYFNVHGGITFSDQGETYPIPENKDLWWFGFDCAHCDDKTKHFNHGEERTLEYVIEECENLAQQFKDFDTKENGQKVDD